MHKIGERELSIDIKSFSWSSKNLRRIISCDKYCTNVLEFVERLKKIRFEPNEYIKDFDWELKSICSEGKPKTSNNVN